MRLELAIALSCLALPLLLRAAEFGYVALASRVGGSASLTFLVRIVLAVACVLLPAVLMGGTLPVLARHAIGEVHETRAKVAVLYSLNSFGAVLGAAVAGFVTLPLLGVYASLGVAALLNLVAAALLWGPARRESADVSGAPDRAEPVAPAGTETYGPLQYRVALAALALSGFAAMGYEVLFTRVISLSFGSSTYSFTVMLMSFITGISLGSAIVSRLRIRRPLFLLGVSQLLVMIALLAVTPLVSRLPYLIGLLRIELGHADLGFELFQVAKAGLCLAVLLLPTTCLGLSFPIVAQIQARGAHDIGGRVGTTYAWNTVGNVLGVVVTSLLLLPWLGLLGSFHWNFGLNLLAGLGLLAVAPTPSAGRRLGPVFAAAASIALYATLGGGWLQPLQMSRNHLRMTAPDPEDPAGVGADHPTASFEAWKQRYVAQPGEAHQMRFAEDAYASVLAIDDGGEAFLYVNTKPDASTRQDLQTQMLLAHAPLFLNPHARSLLVIGYGSGITIGSALQHPIERADVVEISQAVIDVDPVFSEWNYDALEDPRVQVHLEDAQGFLRTSGGRYDVIISEPTNPWIAGVSGLFTVEFFERVRDRLAPGGVAAIWIQQYNTSRDTVQLILRTLSAVFPQVSLWHSPNYLDLVAVASEGSLEPDFAAMEARFDRREIRNDIARMGVPNLASYLIQNAVGPQRFRTSLEPGRVNTIAHQRLEYVAPRDFFHDATSSWLQEIDPLRQGTPPPTDALLDRYALWRQSVGDPLRPDELEYVASRSREPTAEALRARASDEALLARPGARPARGGVSKPSDMGLYEAAYWWNRFKEEGRASDAAAYLRRAASLVENP